MEYLKRFLEYAPEAYDAIRDADDIASKGLATLEKRIFSRKNMLGILRMIWD
ncbi:hypothetical protein PQG02_17555 [Nostoc sp. UHCC 0926]|uniref:hypothetical protein n=1 Tax=Nostoc sp. TaxID=1180 RepID=UPI00279E96AA|nr:hypothetical protein PQG02_17555 [Nostoc sp. UHCC 0926]